MDSNRHRNHEEDHDLGLAADLPRLLHRRRLLGLLGGAGLAAGLVACTPETDSSAPTTGPTAGPSGESSAATGSAEIPEETGGPFPADGSNGVNVLTESGVVRRDIRSSFGSTDGSATGTADGVPLTFTLTVVDVSSAEVAGSPVAGAAVYVWHCDRDGNYSMYSEAARDENYLRGVQETDKDGRATFTSVFPGCYAGRWPHIHFEVYPSLLDATQARNRQRTSQLAFPDRVCREVYAEAGYEQSVRNIARLSLDTDSVFSDGYSLQLATMTGSVSDGYRATLRVPI